MTCVCVIIFLTLQKINSNKIEKILKEYDNKVSGGITTMTYKVTQKILLKEGATLCLFEGINRHGVMVRSSAIVFPSGEVMVLDDWQGACPINQGEIEDFEWKTTDGKQTIMFDGLPRIL